MKPTIRRCPYCKEKIQPNAIKCKHCGSMLTDMPDNVVYDNETLIKRALANRFTILGSIGEGGMAIVFKAIQKNLDRQVALKVLRPNLVYDQEFLIRFHREARTAAKLHHPNIITIYDEGSENNTHFIAMELLDGMDLEKRIKHHRTLSVDELLHLIIPILDALDYAHKNNVVHRDIKSQNIFLNRDGRSILTDFGIAHDMGGTQLTISGTILGTPEIMSPEQADGKETDWRTDIYSIGALMYEALTGAFPFESKNRLAVIYKIINENHIPIRQRKQIPPWLEFAIESCLIKDRTKRIQSAAELKEILINKKKVSKKLFQPKQDSHSTIKFTKDILEIPQKKTEVEIVQHSQAPIKTPPKIQPYKTGEKKNSLTIVLSTITAIIFITIIFLLTQKGFTPVGKVPDPPNEETINGKGPISGDKPDTPKDTVIIINPPPVPDGPKPKPEVEQPPPVVEVEVPDVVGLNPDEAASELKDAGLRANIVLVFAGAEKTQKVIRQNPRGGAKVRKGSSITLTVGE